MGSKVSTQRVKEDQAKALITEAAKFVTSGFDDDDLVTHVELMISCTGLPRTAQIFVRVLERDAVE